MGMKSDPKIIDLARDINSGVNPIAFFNGFLDDIFMVYTGTVESLHSFHQIHHVAHCSLPKTKAEYCPV